MVTLWVYSYRVGNDVRIIEEKKERKEKKKRKRKQNKLGEQRVKQMLTDNVVVKETSTIRGNSLEQRNVR